MKGALFEAPHRIAVADLPDPVRGGDEAVVRVLGATICGSDLTILDGRMGGVSYPLVPGHEWVGEVVDAGPEHRALVGKRVVSDILESCGGCANCRRDLPNLCGNLVEPGLTRPGAFAEYLSVRTANLIELPESIDTAQAPLIEPLSVALYALRRVPVAPGATVAVMGGGGIGQLIAAACVASGTSVGLVDPHPHRRALAAGRPGCTAFAPDAALTEQWLDSGLPAPDCVFEASGDPAALASAIDLVREAGTIGVVGYAGTAPASIEPAKIMTKLITIRGVLSPTGTWHDAIDQVASGKVSLHGIVTHTFALGSIADAFDLMRKRSDGAVRVAVAP